MEGQPNSGEQQPPTGDATGQQQGGNAGQQGNGGAGDDKRFTQAELDAIVKDRLDRERQRRERDAEAQKAKADEDRLKEQQKFSELADQRQKRIEELEPYQSKAERYEQALTTLLEAERKDLPGHITALLDKLDPAEQLEWIAANREAIGQASQQNGTGVRSIPRTPKPAGQPGRDDQIQEKYDRLSLTGQYRPIA